MKLSAPSSTFGLLLALSLLGCSGGVTELTGSDGGVSGVGGGGGGYRQRPARQRHPRQRRHPQRGCRHHRHLVHRHLRPAPHRRGTAGPVSKPSACVRSKVAAALPAGWVQSLGTHPVGTTLTFTVPSNTQSLSIVSQGVSVASDTINYGGSLDNAAVPDQLLGPSSTLYYSDLAAPPSNGASAYVWDPIPSPNTGTTTLPNTTAMFNAASGLIPSGTWSMKVNDYAYECKEDFAGSGCTGGTSANTYDITVVTKPGPALASGVVNVAFYIVDPSLTAAEAVSDTHFTRMVATFAKLYANANICLGDVTVYDVPAWAQDAYGDGINADEDGPCSDISQLFTLSRPGNTLNVFLVGSIVAGSEGQGTQVVGKDGSIPGPSGFGGSVGSGAIASAADLSSGTCTSIVNPIACGADEVAYIVAHEGGHWLGLFHTTEAYGDDDDPLSGTSACACDSCYGTASKCYDNSHNTNTAHVMGVAECSVASDSASSGCGGGDDMMFWLLDTGSKGNLAAEQGKVMRANPLVLPVAP